MILKVFFPLKPYCVSIVHASSVKEHRALEFEICCSGQRLLKVLCLKKCEEAQRSSYLQHLFKQNMPKCSRLKLSPESHTKLSIYATV